MSTPAFTTSQIAIALGKSKRAVQLALERTKPDDLLLVMGQQVEAWAVTSLPLRYQRELESIAERRFYRNSEHLLSGCQRRFAPIDEDGKEVPIAEIAQYHVVRAVRLRSAVTRRIEFVNPSLRPPPDALPIAPTRRSAHFVSSFPAV